ncbi:MAG: tetratricopeptide repeat protein, partial [Alphaproteobacteria bacterium]|nr:tetratricopeptide repeat protein [Alphaproteobacteria bacterium]
MFKHFRNTLLFTLLFAGPVMAQSIEGLKDIVSIQQEKILRMEDNIKKLVGSLEQQSNFGTQNKNLKVLENQVNELSSNIRQLENNIRNITNLSYDLDFALKRIERHLELKAIQDDNTKEVNDFKSKAKPTFQKQKIENVKKKSLDGKTDGVLGFIKEAPDTDAEKQKKVTDTEVVDNNDALKLSKVTAEESYNYALDLARQLDFENAEKAFKEFLIKHKNNKLQADAQYWLGRVYFAQKKYEEAAIAMAEFNSIFPNDPRFQETTLLIAEAAVNFAPKNQLCDILNQSLEFMVNP